MTAGQAADAPDLPREISASVSEQGDASAGIGTAAEMDPGDIFTGRIGFNGDRDWVSIGLTAGFYRVSLTGTSLSDPILRAYTASGVLSLTNDDAWDNDSEFVLHVETSGTWFMAAGSYGDRGTGGYQLEVTSIPVPDPLDSIIWGTRLDDSATVQVWFARPGEFVDDGYGGVIADGFTLAEIDMLTGILDGVSDFAGIRFARAGSKASADLVFALDFLDPDTLGYFNPPGNGRGAGVGVFTSDPDFWYAASLRPGGFMYGIILHELGHGLGLAHPHDLGGASEMMAGVGEAGDTGAFGLNDGVYTLMSYNDGWTAGDAPNGGRDLGYSSGYSALDIGALQDLYGANTTHASGDDVYLFGTRNSFSAIWDTGGLDTLSGAGALRGVVIDLRAATLKTETGGGGFVSHRTDVAGGYTIANGVVIERAVGSGFADIVTGNAAANLLRLGDGADRGEGGAGNDTLLGEGGGDTLAGGEGADGLYGGEGADTLTGGAGDDRMDGGALADSLAGGDGADSLSGGTGADTLDGGAGTDSLAGGGEGDTMSGGEAADTLSGDVGADALYGGAGADRVSGGADADRVEGGTENDLVSGGSGDDRVYGGTGNDGVYGLDGNDQLFGGDGNDILRGDAGNDLLTGGDGADRLVFLAGGGLDRVAGFAEEDVIVLSGLGLDFGDIVISRADPDAVRMRAGEVLVIFTVLTADLDATDFLFG